MKELCKILAANYSNNRQLHFCLPIHLIFLMAKIKMKTNASLMIIVIVIVSLLNLF